jgi:hypothetical protein
MEITKLYLLEKKELLIERYMQAVDVNNTFTSNYLRGKLSLIDEILSDLKKEA